jgi:hypothetical protein
MDAGAPSIGDIDGERDKAPERRALETDRQREPEPDL